MTAIINDAAPGDWIMGLLSGLQTVKALQMDMHRSPKLTVGYCFN